MSICMLFKKTTPLNVKAWHWLLLLVIVLTTIGLNMYYARWPEATVTIAGRPIKVLVADNFAHLMKGWSDRRDMGGYQGMLFIFFGRGDHTMVMRGMNFPLDMVWIDGDSIVDMAQNLPTEPGRTEAQLTPYSARLPSTLVLELPAGFIQLNKLQIGDKITVTR